MNGRRPAGTKGKFAVTSHHAAHSKTAPYRTVMASLSLLVLLAGCDSPGATAPPSVQSAYQLHSQAAAGLPGNPDPKDRMQFSGFSIAPPQGAGWAQTSADTGDDPWKTWIIFWKTLPEPHPEFGPHTAFAAVRSLSTTPEIRSQLSSASARRGFMAAMMNQALMNDEAAAIAVEGLRVFHQNALLDHTLGYDCFSYEVGVEGKGALEDKTFDFVMDLHSYICLDPALGQLVETMYSQLVPQGDSPVDLKREGEDFLRSISFSPLNI